MKKIASIVLALMLTVSMAFPAANGVFATGNGETAPATLNVLDSGPVGENDSQSGEVQEVVRLFQALPSTDELENLSDEELEAVFTALADAIDAYSALSVEDMERFETTYAELYQAVVEELYPAMMGTAGDTPSLFSMRPMQQTSNVYITLCGYTKEQLQKFSVDTFVNSMTKNDGTPISIDEGITSAWFYFYGDEYEEYHVLNEGETIDLWDYDRSSSQYFSTSFSLVLVLGKGKQLDDQNNHRYIVRVEIRSSTAVSGSLSYSFLELDEDDCYAIQKEDPAFVDELQMSGLVVEYHVKKENFNDNGSYSFRFSDTIKNTLERRGISVEVYPVENYLAHRDDGKELTGAITDKIFDSGYQADYSNKEVKADAPNLFYVVFSDALTGEKFGDFGMLVTIQTDENLAHRFEGNLNYYDGKEMSDVLQEYYWEGYCEYFIPTQDHVSFEVDPSEEDNPFTAYFVSTSDWDVYFDYEEGEYSEEDFYFSIEPDDLDELKDVYVGSFYTEEEAISEKAEKITEKIVHKEGQNTVPYGYKIEPIYEEDEDYTPTEFTIVLNDGTVFSCCVNLYCYSVSDDTTVSYRLDPNFNISGARKPKENGSGTALLSTYVADEVQDIPLDTYYRLDEKYDVGGYQLLLINESMTQDQLKAIIPTFDVPSGVQVNSGEKVESGKTNLQNVEWSGEMNSTVSYQVQVPGKEVKNYQVTFATKQSDAKLFVAGPNERFVNLTADNQFVHDILVANIGDQDLTDLKAELIDAENVKLDPYWTIGGEGNDTLPAFTTTSPVNNYATLANIAKVRLVPDGEGAVSGTLRITAADNQVYEIKLTGIAANPKIVTEQLAEAVKYVPYSYVIATNSMYSGIRVDFEITEGTLPKGLSFYEKTGEIYGVPQETGEFPITVRAIFNGSQFTPATAEFTLVVKENSNANVYEQTSEGYAIETPLGVEQGTGTYDFLLRNYRQNQLYVSSGEYGEFMALWLNGEKLVPDEDYTYESGSTRITIKGQTFINKANKTGSNTIAAEFRVDGDRNNDLKTTAQNFRLSSTSTSTSGSSAGGSSSGNALDPAPGSTGQTPGDTTGQTPDDTTGQTPDDTTGQTPGGTTGQTPDDTTGQTPDDTTGQTPGDTTGQTPGGSTGTDSTPAAPKGITLRFQVLNADGSPLVNAPVELHSTPRTGTTDASGMVVFSDVEYGAHTFIVKNSSGEELERLVFSLQEGSLSIDGNVFTAVDGTTLTVSTQLTDEGLSILNVTAPQTDPMVDQAVAAVVFVFAGALAVSAAVVRRKRRKLKG